MRGAGARFSFSKAETVGILVKKGDAQSDSENAVRTLGNLHNNFFGRKFWDEK